MYWRFLRVFIFFKIFFVSLPLFISSLGRFFFPNSDIDLHIMIILLETVSKIFYLFDIYILTKQCRPLESIAIVFIFVTYLILSFRIHKCMPLSLLVYSCLSDLVHCSYQFVWSENITWCYLRGSRVHYKINFC